MDCGEEFGLVTQSIRVLRIITLNLHIEVRTTDFEVFFTGGSMDILHGAIRPECCQILALLAFTY